MAARHNSFGRLLGSVENNPNPLLGAMIPMADVPDLGSVADGIEADAAFHHELMTNHAQRIRDVAAMQPNFSDIQDTGSKRGGVF